MYPRSLFALFLFVLLAILVVNAVEEEAAVEENELARAGDYGVINRSSCSKSIKVIMEFLGKLFAKAAEACLEALAKKCKQYWCNESKLKKCAKKEMNSGTCPK